MATIDVDMDTSQIKDWRSIITLIVFVITSMYRPEFGAHPTRDHNIRGLTVAVVALS